MANDDSDGEELDLEEVGDPFVANYSDENDQETYLNLIQRLVDHLQDQNNRNEAYNIPITEKRNGDERKSYLNSRTLYLLSVKIKGKDIDSNRNNNNADYYVAVSHPTEPRYRKFWSPYYLFYERVDNEYLRIYQSLTITISEAIRFDQIKQYVADNFSIGRHSWDLFAECIHLWEVYSQQPHPRFPAVLWIGAN
jgi:hypothetical protein